MYKSPKGADLRRIFLNQRLLVTCTASTNTTGEKEGQRRIRRWLKTANPD